MSDNKTPVVATKKISYGPEAGDHVPADAIFAPADHGLDIDELNALNAVRECSDADAALYEQQQAAAEPAAPAPKKGASAPPPPPAGDGADIG